MSTKLRHDRLEEAIYGKYTLTEVLGETPAWLADYVVADYVGDYRLDPQRGPDLINASAAMFFEDAGAYIRSYAGSDHGQPFNLAVFATFAVVEIRPYTHEAEFLVLKPAPTTSLADGPYIGLMASQNTDALDSALQDADDLGPLFSDLSRLLHALSGERPLRRKGGGTLTRWIDRIRGRH